MNQEPTNTITEQPKGCFCSDCWKKHHCRVGYFYTNQAIDEQCIECEKPGIGSKEFQGGSCNCPMCCIPCTLVADIICCLPITFGCHTVKKP